MTKTFKIPQYLYDYVKPFADEVPLRHRVKFNNNFPKEGDIWLQQTGYDRRYLFNAIRHGFDSIPVCCVVCGKPLKGSSLVGVRPDRCYKFCSVSCQRKDKETSEKRIKTSLEKYGKQNPMQSKEVLARRDAANVEKYGSIENWKAVCHSKIRSQKLESKLEGFNKKGIELVTPIDEFVNTAGLHKQYTYKCLNCGCVWESTIVQPHLLFCPSCLQNHKSSGENELKRLLNKYETSTPIYNSKKIITPKELDIYYPNLNLAFEYNGSRFHSLNYSYNRIDDFYHQNKTIDCLNKGIRLIHVYDFELQKLSSNVENFLENILNSHEKVIQNPTFTHISQSEYYQFILQYDMNFYHNYANEYYGLHSDNVLIAVVGMLNNFITALVCRSDVYCENWIEVVLQKLHYPQIKLNLNLYDKNLFDKFKYSIRSFGLYSELHLYNHHIITNPLDYRYKKGAVIVDQGYVNLFRE